MSYELFQGLMYGVLGTILLLTFFGLVAGKDE